MDAPRPVRVHRLMTALIMFLFSYFRLTRLDNDATFRLLAVIRFVHVYALATQFQDYADAFGCLASMSVCQQICCVTVCFGTYERRCRKIILDSMPMSSRIVDGELQSTTFREFWTMLRREPLAGHDRVISPLAQSRDALAVCCGAMDETSDEAIKCSVFRNFTSCECEQINSTHRDPFEFGGLCCCIYNARTLQIAIISHDLQLAPQLLCTCCYEECNLDPGWGLDVDGSPHTSLCDKTSANMELITDHSRTVPTQ